MNSKNKWWFRKYVTLETLYIYMADDGRVAIESERNDMIWFQRGFKFIKKIVRYSWRDL